MPLKVNYAGVMPIIFAQSILMFPQQIFLGLGNHLSVPFLQEFFSATARALDYGSVLYLTIYSLMILFFSYFWVATQFNELQIADDLKKNGGFNSRRRAGAGGGGEFVQEQMRRTAARAGFP